MLSSEVTAALKHVQQMSQSTQAAVTKRQTWKVTSNRTLLLRGWRLGSPRSRTQQTWCLVTLVSVSRMAFKPRHHIVSKQAPSGFF
jgi:hypothetical protein